MFMSEQPECLKSDESGSLWDDGNLRTIRGTLYMLKNMSPSELRRNDIVGNVESALRFFEAAQELDFDPHILCEPETLHLFYLGIHKNVLKLFIRCLRSSDEAAVRMFSTFWDHHDETNQAYARGRISAERLIQYVGLFIGSDFQYCLSALLPVLFSTGFGIFQADFFELIVIVWHLDRLVHTVPWTMITQLQWGSLLKAYTVVCNHIHAHWRTHIKSHLLVDHSAMTYEAMGLPAACDDSSIERGNKYLRRIYQNCTNFKTAGRDITLVFTEAAGHRALRLGTAWIDEATGVLRQVGNGVFNGIAR